jgi:hypothetical protein
MLSSATSRGPASAPPVVQLSWAEQGTALQALPVDRSRTEGVRAVRGFTYALVDPTPVARPHLLLARWGGPAPARGDGPSLLTHTAHVYAIVRQRCSCWTWTWPRRRRTPPLSRRWRATACCQGPSRTLTTMPGTRYGERSPLSVSRPATDLGPRSASLAALRAS